MNSQINFPVRVQYTNEYLINNPGVKQRQGVAVKMARNYERALSIKWDNRKGKGLAIIQIDYLEEVTDTTNPLNDGQ